MWRGASDLFVHTNTVMKRQKSSVNNSTILAPPKDGGEIGPSQSACVPWPGRKERETEGGCGLRVALASRQAVQSWTWWWPKCIVNEMYLAFA